jgi:EmrB/QacA subfamily drug resistance transporter
VINPRAIPSDLATIRATRSTQRCPRTDKPWVLAAAVLGSGMAFIDGTAVNVALPAMEAGLAASIAAMQWVVNSYTLFLAANLLIGGAAGDRFGRRRIFVIGVASFTAASVWCGLAPGVMQLIVARAIQGIGGALLVPSTLAIIGASFEPAERGRAIGTWAGFSAVTTAIGPVLGGWLVDGLSWRAIFFINVPIALLTLWITLRHVPESRDPEAPPELDWVGALLVLAGLSSLVFGPIASAELGWRHPAVMTTLIAAPLLLAAFLWWEKRSRAPMMPLALFKSRTFSGINVVTFLLYAALGGALFFLPFNLVQLQGYSASEAGAAFLPFTIIMGGLSRWSGGLLDRFGARRPLIIGPAIAALGFALLAAPGAGGSYWSTFFVPLVILAFGMAVSVAPLTTAVMNAVPDREMGIASGINNAVARVAGLIAVALLGAVALGVYDRSLDRHSANLAIPPDAKKAVASLHGTLATALPPSSIASEERQQADSAVAASFLAGFRAAALLSAGLALAGTLSTALTIAPDRHQARRAS